MASGVMVPIEQIHRNSCPVQPTHLADKKQSGSVVAPIAVIKVAGDDQEGNPLFDCESDQLIKSFPGGGANGVSRRTFMSGKAPQGTVQMNICGVYEAKWVHNGSPLSGRVPLR